MNVVFTLCSNNYLAQAKILADTYLQHHPDGKFVIGLVDKLSPQIDYTAFSSVQILPCDSLGCSEFEEMKLQYLIVEFNTAVKPFYFDYFFKNGFTKVIYLDPDIGVFQPLSDLWAYLTEFDILLTPHTITSTHPYADRWQQISNAVGIYNLGFLALAKSINTDNLLTWWKAKLQTQCFMRPAEGLFVDQIWANFFPVYFEKCKIVMDPGYNMGYWNFGERQLTFRDGTYWVNDTKLKFFHFSNLKLDSPDVISGYSDFTFSQRPDLVVIYKDYIRALLKNHHTQYKKINPAIRLRSDKLTWTKKLGLGIKVYGTRYLNKTVKFLFGV